MPVIANDNILIPLLCSRWEAARSERLTCTLHTQWIPILSSQGTILTLSTRAAKFSSRLQALSHGQCIQSCTRTLTGEWWCIVSGMMAPRHHTTPTLITSAMSLLDNITYYGARHIGYVMLITPLSRQVRCVVRCPRRPPNCTISIGD